MNKTDILKSLGYNKGIIEDVKAGRRFCTIYEENELDDLCETYGCTIEQIEAGIDGIDIFNHENGKKSFVVLEV